MNETLIARSRFTQIVTGALKIVVILIASTLPALAQSVSPQGAQAGQAADVDMPLSPAQKLIFDSPHLRNINKPIVLNYNFARKGAQLEKLGLAFKDRVSVIITKVRPGGGKDMSFEFFTGRRRLPFADLENFKGNPIVMLFLNNDLRAQKKVLGGHANYFRNRIREALRVSASVEDIMIEVKSGKIPARKIVIHPYRGDRNRAKFKAYERKIYEFILARDIPGGIYSLRSYVPNGNGSAAVIAQRAIAQEEMKFVSSADLKPAALQATTSAKGVE